MDSETVVGVAIYWEGVLLYQMLLTFLAGDTNHGVVPPVTSGKSQEEEVFVY